VVLDINAIIPFRVIETEIVILLLACRLDLVFVGFRHSFDFLGTLSEVIDLREIKDFHLFIFREHLCAEVLKALGGGHRYLKVQLLGGCSVAERPLVNRLAGLL
jgi:hypothetical protein